MSKQNKHLIKGKKKRSDLQSFLDYFSMLSEYLDKGYLQIDVAKHEVYVTQPAIHALSPGNDPAEQLRNGAIARTALRLRAWAAWMSGEGNDYMKLSVVQPNLTIQDNCRIPKNLPGFVRKKSQAKVLFTFFFRFNIC